MRTIYTDGACSGNPGPGGCAMLELSTKDGLPYLQHADCIYYKNTTNNRMELEAMINAFKYIQIIKTDDEFEIYSDSAYVVNMCNDWIWKWAHGPTVSAREPRMLMTVTIWRRYINRASSAVNTPRKSLMTRFADCSACTSALP